MPIPPKSDSLVQQRYADKTAIMTERERPETGKPLGERILVKIQAAGRDSTGIALVGVPCGASTQGTV
ncbi:hypothetical protein BSK56_05450 [Paenibacillus borealis]|uniref:10 kDa chaperonin n=1 Tax=Paenibacillus borealis TaxID=160799 RepID=A0ABX3HKW3_PAEBO|nr:hypothetical protein BSK56_05450 [Paenibacillus borealis]